MGADGEAAKQGAQSATLPQLHVDRVRAKEGAWVRGLSDEQYLFDIHLDLRKLEFDEMHEIDRKRIGVGSKRGRE